MTKIAGNVVGIPNPQSDWNQLDATKADFIKNKPTVLTEEDILKLIGESGADGVGIEDIYSTADDTGRQMVVIITLTDGRQLSFGVPFGEKGEDGKDGNGIDSIVITEDESSRTTGIFIYDTKGVGDSGVVPWGKDGKTPEKGVDYWTEEDKAEIKDYVDNEIGNYETAISEIIELQKQFINEITFNLNGTNYTCPKGMTWAELETYDGGTIWQAEGLSIQGSVIYVRSIQLTTWNMNIPTSLATYTSDIIRDVADHFNYSV